MKQTLVFRIIVIIMLLAIIFLIIFCCCRTCKIKDWHEYIKLDSTKKESDSQMVVWRKPGVTDAELSRFLADVRAKVSNEITIFRFCKGCDDSLFLLDGAEQFLEDVLMQGGGKKKGDPATAQGDVGGIFFSTNTNMSSVDVIRNCESDSDRTQFDTPVINLQPRMFAQRSFQTDSTYQSKNPNQNEQRPPEAEAVDTPYQRCDTIRPRKPLRDKNVVVAVFDTGVDTVGGWDKYMYKAAANDNSCLATDAANGWNFAGRNSNWNDDNAGEYHGTIVTRQIINEVYARNSEYGVKILPVKVLDSNGACHLYDLLCAFKYAQDRHAQIINASLGYYSYLQINTPPGGTEADNDNDFLRTYIQTVLTANNILLVCAAGNQFPSDPVHYPSKDLDRISFFPASLSPELRNVIAVTTVNDNGSSQLTPGSVSPFQNYSRNVVDVGVQARSNRKYIFQNPLAARTALNGSSFATPLVTAALCRNYNLVNNVLQTTWIKDDVMQQLVNNHVFIISTTGLDRWIVDGKTYYR